MGCHPRRGRRGKFLKRAYEDRLVRFRDAVKALIQTTNPDDRKNLEVPQEWALYHRCRRNGVLPHAGGLYDQDYYLMLLFDIIEYEYNEWQRIQEINRKLQKAWEEKQRASSS